MSRTGETLVSCSAISRIFSVIHTDFFDRLNLPLPQGRYEWISMHVIR